MLTNKQFQNFNKELNSVIQHYKENCSNSEGIDWVKYERKYAQQIRYVAKELNFLIKDAMSLIGIKTSNIGRKSKLSLQQKIVALLLKSIFGKHNRPMAGLLTLFGVFVGMDISYKISAALLCPLSSVMFRYSEAVSSSIPGDINLFPAPSFYSHDKHVMECHSDELVRIQPLDCFVTDIHTDKYTKQCQKARHRAIVFAKY